MAQGLDRHEALLAIAFVLIKYINAAVRGEVPGGDPNRRYHAALGRLNAQSWLRSG
jgi:hypothetical protein